MKTEGEKVVALSGGTNDCAIETYQEESEMILSWMANKRKKNGRNKI